MPFGHNNILLRLSIAVRNDLVRFQIWNSLLKYETLHMKYEINILLFYNVLLGCPYNVSVFF